MTADTASPPVRVWPRDARATPVGSIGREAGSFVLIGLASTAAFAVLYAVLRTVAPAFVANALALLVTAVGNTAANRRLTFGVRGPRSFARDHAAGLIAFAVALAITSGSIAALQVLAPRASQPMELGLLTIANVVATLMRFVLLRSWIANRGLSIPGLSRPVVGSARSAS